MTQRGNKQGREAGGRVSRLSLLGAGVAMAASLLFTSAAQAGTLLVDGVMRGVAVASVAQTPRAPINVAGTDNGQGSVRLTWSDQNGGAMAHVIERVPTLGATTSVNAGTNSYIDQTAGNGTHEYRVGARNAAGALAWSGWISVAVTSGTAGSGVGAPSSAGWTPLVPSSDSRLIYVSSSEGNDANSGTSADAPLRTIAAGYAKLRHNFPDWVMLKRGDTFVETLGHMKKSGRSPLEPLVIGTYGTNPARPLLRCWTNNGLDRSPGGNTPPKIENLAIVGLHFLANDRTSVSGGQGIRWIGSGANILIEDCLFEKFGFGMNWDGYDSRVQNLKIKRSLILDSHQTSFHSSGIFCNKVDGLTIEECIIDHNGWLGAAPATMFNHNIYIDMECTGVVLQGNIISDASSHGAQMRPGGVCSDNLFIRNPINLIMGFGGLEAGADVDPEQPAVIDCRRNVFMDARDINASMPRGWGINVQWTTGGTIAENLFTGQTGNYPLLIELDGNTGEGVFQVAIQNNISYNWHAPLKFIGDRNAVSQITVANNILQDPAYTTYALVEHEPTSNLGQFTMSNNKYFRGGSQSQWFIPGSTLASYRSIVGDTTSVVQQVNFADSGRNISRYSTSVGGSGSYADFIANARLQSRYNWREQYRAASVIAYMRQGFTPQ